MYSHPGFVEKRGFYTHSNPYFHTSFALGRNVVKGRAISSETTRVLTNCTTLDSDIVHYGELMFHATVHVL